MKDGSFLYNLAIVRGHNYYTGTVFEAYIKGKRSLGAIGGGGRYDNLCGNFIDQNMQGVGMSIGITRLLIFCEAKTCLIIAKTLGLWLELSPLTKHLMLAFALWQV